MKVHYPKLYNMAHLFTSNVFTDFKGSNNYILLVVTVSNHRVDSHYENLPMQYTDNFYCRRTVITVSFLQYYSYFYFCILLGQVFVTRVHPIVGNCYDQVVIIRCKYLLHL